MDEQLILWAARLAGVEPHQVLAARRDGDAIIAVIDFGIAGGKKARFLVSNSETGADNSPVVAEIATGDKTGRPRNDTAAAAIVQEKDDADQKAAASNAESGDAVGEHAATPKKAGRSQKKGK